MIFWIDESSPILLCVTCACSTKQQIFFPDENYWTVYGFVDKYYLRCPIFVNNYKYVMQKRTDYVGKDG